MSQLWVGSKKDSGIKKLKVPKRCISVIYELSFLDALREELENSERVANCEGEVKRLREILQLKESDVESLRRKTRLMEVNTEERFHEEKEKIVQILGEFLLFLVQAFLRSPMVQKLKNMGLNIHLPLFIKEKDVLYLLNCLESNLFVTYITDLLI